MVDGGRPPAVQASITGRIQPQPHHKPMSADQPREYELPDGGIATVKRMRGTVRESVTVPPAKRGFYDLLSDILLSDSPIGIEPVFVAYLTRECDTLPAAEQQLRDVERGTVSLDGAAYGLSITRPAAKAIGDYRDAHTIKLAAVGCSGSKFEDAGLLPAVERYKGSYWQNKRKYGKFCADQMKIISAEHDLLDPETPIEYYERTPDDWEGIFVDADTRLPSGDDVETRLDQWALDVYNGLSQWVNSATGQWGENNVELDILLGQAYIDPLAQRGVFDTLAAPCELTVNHPFQDVPEAQGGLFEQIGWMGDQVEQAKMEAADTEQATIE